MSPPSIMTFWFIRNPPALAKHDDKADITCVDGNRFILQYTYGKADPKISTEKTLSRSEISHWLQMVARLMEADIDPFRGIQVQYSLLPDVLLDVKRLGDHYNLLMDVLGFFFDTATPQT